MFLSVYYLRAKADSPSFLAELTEFAQKVSDFLSSETVLLTQYRVPLSTKTLHTKKQANYLSCQVTVTIT